MNRFPQIGGEIAQKSVETGHSRKIPPTEKTDKYLHFTLINLFNLHKYYNIPKVAK